MKKSTSKKTVAKSARRPARTAKASNVSLKTKKSPPASRSQTAKPSQKPAAAVSKVETRKPTPAGRSPEVQKTVSQNGKAQWDENHKGKKLQEKAEQSSGKAAAPPTPAPEPKVKTYLSAKELKDFKGLLLAKRAELAGDVENLTSQALNRKTDGVNEPSFMPIHMADLGSDTWEQDFTLGLIANEQALVREIDEALARIEDKTYGMCIATDKPISKERLLAKPWAKYCIEYARLREEGRAP